MNERGHDKMYELICSERFTKIDGKQDEIIDLLRGKNGFPGLIDDVRTLKARWKVIYATAGIVTIAVVKEVIAWISGVI